MGSRVPLNDGSDSEGELITAACELGRSHLSSRGSVEKPPFSLPARLVLSEPGNESASKDRAPYLGGGDLAANCCDCPRSPPGRERLRLGGGLWAGGGGTTCRTAAPREPRCPWEEAGEKRKGEDGERGSEGIGSRA
ncbi:hypothetical protein EYF80_047581 [Liparis tanakae]|uniref:Uncharacterized protein n=1 Tax=Liparis tanakae TaxID=230148 RepID=A0A4Z2FMJ5_9TELE|nr:hypothetical protein EYF80_047581 [Liparis tanakae]